MCSFVGRRVDRCYFGQVERLFDLTIRVGFVRSYYILVMYVFKYFVTILQMKALIIDCTPA